jgi:hypothetical protein
VKKKYSINISGLLVFVLFAQKKIEKGEIKLTVTKEEPNE